MIVTLTYKLIYGFDEQVTLHLYMATIGQHHTRGNSRKLKPFNFNNSNQLMPDLRFQAQQSQRDN